MIAELGHIALILAFCVAIVQGTAPLYGAHKGWADYMRLGASAAYVQAGLLGLSFIALTAAFLASDFSVKLVADHSHVDKPLLYKISGVWGNHEGSMLLWVLILALFGAMIGLFGRNLPLPLKARTLAIQGLIGVAFLAFILFTSNPFWRLDPAPEAGADLNPLLQDPGLAFHPPFLYLGYVGLSTSFSFAVAALIEGRVDAAWARWVRPWTLAAWMFLTLGIALGSWWAYYELGWGGWWFWDPVENASFMPWLAAAALFHSAIVVEKRGELKSWTILLAIIGFSLSLIGTFIVRSGLLTSVHAFASDPTRGVFVLTILAISVGGALALFSWRAKELASDGVFAPISREGALLFNNLLLSVACVAVFVGTLAPLAYEAAGRTITVGAPWFDLIFGALMIPLLMALPIGAMLPWKRGDLTKALPKLGFVIGVTLLIMIGFWAIQTDYRLAGPIGVGLGAWVALGAIMDVLDRAKLGRAPLAETGRRLWTLPRSDWGKTFGHFGVGVMTIGIAASIALETEDVRLVQPGEAYTIGGYEFVFRGVLDRAGPNFDAKVAVVEQMKDGALVEILQPETRQFRAAQTVTAEVGLSSGFMRDIYVVLGDQRENGAWVLRTYVKPYVSWIWLGALVMAFGGAVSLSDPRHRVGAPAARRERAKGAKAPAAVPAE
ncbi:MAG: heme lyase CcmF/NrfE family subunit [Pseudomonadota bacterium]